MEIADELLINTSSEEVIDTPSSKDVFSSITSDDIRMYFAKKEKGLSLRQLAAEFNITKSTALNKINLVERLLKEVSFEVLSEHLKELKDQRETERPS